MIFKARLLQSINSQNTNQNQQMSSNTQQRNYFCQLKQKYHRSLKVLFQEFQIQKQLILDLSKIVQKDQNELTLCQDMRAYIRALYSINTNYVTIVPYIFIKHMVHHISKRQFVQINKYLLTQIEYFGDRHVRKQIKQIKEEQHIKLGLPQQQIKKFKKYYNLFQKKSSFTNIQQLIQQVDNVSKKSKGYMSQFVSLVEKISLENKGKGFKANMKLPEQDSPLKKFKNYIRIIQKLFQKQFQHKTYQEIFIQKIQKIAKSWKNQKISDIGLLFMDAMIEIVQLILKQKRQNNIPLNCFIPDFIRANTFFERKINLVEAAKNIIVQCEKRKYQIIYVTQRVGRGSHQIVFKIRIHDCIAQFQLVQSREDLQTDIQTREYIHSLYQIRRSPLGAIFGCFLLLSKYQRFLFQDVVCQILKNEENEEIRRAVSNLASIWPNIK